MLYARVEAEKQVCVLICI